MTEEVYSADRLDADAARGVTYDCSLNGHAYRVTACGTSKAGDCLLTHEYEHWVRQKWWYVRDGDIVLDVGADFGSYTLPALAAGAEVIAVEPDRDALLALLTNLYVNGWQGRCACVPVLCGAAPGVAPYHLTSHSARRLEGFAEPRYATTVDELCAALERLDWIKIDVEGAEVDVLRGATQTLKRLGPNILVELHEEFVPGVGNEVERLMAGYGYRLADFLNGEKANDHWGLWEKGT